MGARGWNPHAVDIVRRRYVGAASDRFDTAPRKQDQRTTRRSAPVLPFEILSTFPLAIRIPVQLPSLSNTRDATWRARDNRTRSQRRITANALLATGVRGPTLLPCTVTMTRVSPGLLDTNGNLENSTKAPQDEIAKWLGLSNDNDPRVTFRTEQRREHGYACEVRFEPRGEP